ncbi:hypothetical protein DVH24_004178 [Malus domestica]|uniref:Uncharacterized protein n=1 Tax=Malus domestica TaxID=3750 RepID=A0A498K817_MALDO|nr:hypothetical protein DVH24_004178 [Malus domestica]
MVMHKISETMERRMVSIINTSQLKFYICLTGYPSPTPYDLRQLVEFAHAIVVAMGNNCSNAEWRSRKYVHDCIKKVVMDELLYTLDDDTNKELMKLMEAVLEGGYNRWRYDVKQSGAPSK